ncbi:hypothetical protein JDM601_3247 [Mycolicibacter sinensis]|uniref:Uncharacterized protein n=1 Tax=Mycolicibacter sinensis (strain JDM601) TaxID=875328 RepID=F5YXP3_MYCSD|nr:hypothetical protein JDM601_3247 [Mycolicibacter sinensis]
MPHGPFLALPRPSWSVLVLARLVARAGRGGSMGNRPPVPTLDQQRWLKYRPNQFRDAQ